MHKMKRRSFVAMSLSFAGFCIFAPAHRISGWFNRLRLSGFISDNELDIAAFAARYVYPSGSTPGAKELGIREFFKRQLRDDHNLHYYQSIRQICSVLEKSSRTAFMKPFCRIGKNERQALLSDLFNGDLPVSRTDLNKFIDFTLEGCFCDPMHGGNSEYSSWQVMEGFIRKEWFHV
ncbi:hypothetical protein CHISP_0520 [Chitinispirillum alkaliphilum]|nr:hypothetical protein CHISP_0520 [Chitinispirillum alkaliphilum]